MTIQNNIHLRLLFLYSENFVSALSRALFIHLALCHLSLGDKKGIHPVLIVVVVVVVVIVVVVFVVVVVLVVVIVVLVAIVVVVTEQQQQ